mmetsp:Transcript_6849/g.22191  ORF Transcript_6849/g.22191 Transcript_6849/m.22191 type:complete len:254 (-) Transcript_6849:238-999(-)
MIPAHRLKRGPSCAVRSGRAPLRRSASASAKSVALAARHWSARFRRTASAQSGLAAHFSGESHGLHQLKCAISTSSAVSTTGAGRYSKWTWPVGRTVRAATDLSKRKLSASGRPNEARPASAKVMTPKTCMSPRTETTWAVSQRASRKRSKNSAAAARPQPKKSTPVLAMRRESPTSAGSARPTTPPRRVSSSASVAPSAATMVKSEDSPTATTAAAAVAGPASSIGARRRASPAQSKAGVAKTSPSTYRAWT